MKKTFTSEEKKQYFADLRLRWARAKELSIKEQYQIAFAEAQKLGVQCSVTSFVLTSLEMEEKGLGGIPYLDCKTFQGWKESGMIVNKGEKAAINGITWVGGTDKENKENDSMLKSNVYPKIYSLFHRSQAKPL